MIRPRFQFYGPFDAYTEKGKFVRSFRVCKDLILKFDLYGKERPKGKWRKSGDLSYWRWKTFSIAYGSKPKTSRIRITCELETRPKLGIIVIEKEIPYTCYEMYMFAIRKLDILVLHETKVDFCQYPIQLEKYVEIGPTSSQLLMRCFDAHCEMFENTRKERNNG